MKKSRYLLASFCILIPGWLFCTEIKNDFLDKRSIENKLLHNSNTIEKLEKYLKYHTYKATITDNNSSDINKKKTNYLIDPSILKCTKYKKYLENQRKILLMKYTANKNNRVGK